MVEVPGDGDDGVGGPIRRPPEVPDRLVGEGADVRLVAADLAAERSVAEHRGLEQDLRVLGRVVLVAADLLDDDAPLALRSRRALSLGPDDQLADDVHRRGAASRCGTRTQ